MWKNVLRVKIVKEWRKGKKSVRKGGKRREGFGKESKVKRIGKDLKKWWKKI